MTSLTIYHNPKCSKSRETLALLNGRGVWIDALVKDPILIERPIVVRGSRAVIGRPPENALALLDP